VTLQPRLWWVAVRRQRDRAWIVAEATAVVMLLGASVAAIPWTLVPAGYAALMIAGSWVFPFVTSYIPHDSHGHTTLTRTRLFRGRILSLVALEHLYHLEHHLYPQVPHHNWPRLAKRLDPYFEQAGVRPVKLLF
jgi:beta-carotene hydroxylase